MISTSRFAATLTRTEIFALGSTDFRFAVATIADSCEGTKSHVLVDLLAEDVNRPGKPVVLQGCSATFEEAEARAVALFSNIYTPGDSAASAAEFARYADEDDFLWALYLAVAAEATDGISVRKADGPSIEEEGEALPASALIQTCGCGECGGPGVTDEPTRSAYVCVACLATGLTLR